MKRYLIVFLMTAMIAFSISKVNAKITVGGYSFDDNAFADEVTDFYGGWQGGIETIRNSVLGPNITYCAADYTYDENSFIKVAFTDNSIVNGPGIDLIIFETSAGQALGCPVKITISGITSICDTYWLGPGDLHAAMINLDDFSVASGSRVSTITLWGNAPYDPDYMGLGALNNGEPVPEPATLLLLAFGGLILRRRK